AHILLEQAEHIAAVIARGREVGARYLEPTAEAEEAWVRTVHETALDTRAFQAECTPGYYNGEGTRSIAGATFSPGPIAFHRLLRAWREDGMGDVLVGAGVGASR
ncbi:hypothetical protein EDF54_2848, partial [Rathayibacter sp. PhB93]